MLTANAAGFGPWTVSGVTFNGTDGSTGLAAGSFASSAQSFTIIGKGTKGTVDGSGTPGSTYGNLMSTQGAVTILDGLTTTLGNTTSNFGANSAIGSTTAMILQGTLASANTVTMTWRSRSNAEIPANSHAAAGALPLFSDVVNLQGITGGASSVYTLQMTYAPGELGGQAGAATAASGGFLFLGYRNSSGTWVNATTVAGDGNTGVGGSVVPADQGVIGPSYAAFTTTNGITAGNLSAYLGSWGVDTADNEAWAIIDHSGQEFAVVPEPGTLALFGRRSGGPGGCLSPPQAGEGLNAQPAPWPAQD